MTKTDSLICHQCGTEIENGNEYKFEEKIVCEDCGLTIQPRPIRKTHWRYLKSIKTDYLRPGNTT